MKAIFLTAAQLTKLVEVAKDARNIDESPVTFSIEPTELIYAYNLAESKGMDVIAIFHSHPAKAWPSSTDMKFMEINPVIWVIYSTTENQLKAFVYDDDDFIKEIDIRIISGVRA
jgi:proteasome lid subunit RPN8/RPN11